MYSCHRSGNISKHEFTHPKFITIFLYAWHVEQQYKIKQIYGYTEHSLATKFDRAYAVL